MPLTRPIPPTINQANQNWQAEANAIRNATFATPFPPAVYANEGALPSASSYGGCIAIVENFASTGKPILAISDGLGWRFQVVDNYAKSNGNGSNAYVDLIHPLMAVAEGFEIDFFLDPSSLPGNAHVALAVYDNSSTPALVTGNQYAARGSARYGVGVVADWSHTAQGYAAIGYVGASNYLAAGEDAFGTVKFTRGGSNSAWHFSCQMYYDISAAPGTGAQRMFSSQGTVFVPSSKLLAGVRLYLRDASSSAGATGTLIGALAATSRVRVSY